MLGHLKENGGFQMSYKAGLAVGCVCLCLYPKFPRKRSSFLVFSELIANLLGQGHSWLSEQHLEQFQLCTLIADGQAAQLFIRDWELELPSAEP